MEFRIFALNALRSMVFIRILCVMRRFSCEKSCQVRYL